MEAPHERRYHLVDYRIDDSRTMREWLQRTSARDHRGLKTSTELAECRPSTVSTPNAATNHELKAETASSLTWANLPAYVSFVEYQLACLEPGASRSV